MTTLKLWTNGVETYLAESPADIPALYEKQTGGTYDPDEHGEWEERSEDGPLTIVMDTSNNDNPRERVTKTFGEWIATNGPGFLCSTEY